jgi:hypothetical protein
LQFKLEVNKSATGWEVQVRDARDDTALLAQPRVLRRVGEGLQAFPLPPQAEAEVLMPTEIDYDLCNSTEPTLLKTAYNQIVSRDVGTNDRVARFGRYLFHTLLGDTVWQQMDAKAGSEPLELALTWQPDDYAINRLPWEMMYGPKQFLAQAPQITITRRVANTAQTLSEIKPPRVLIVVGSSLNDTVIRPGAEYLGLMRSLACKSGAKLKTNLLLEASPRRLKAAVESFDPTVVHFICHGEFNAAGQCYLKLRDDEKSDATTQLFAAGLIENLRKDDDLPQIVVLSACYSAKLNDRVQYLSGGEVNAPLAIDLLKAGVPVVVGMGGKVSDQACRLFTRRFYEALLGGEDIATATADGRRAGIIANSGTNPLTTVDWAMPTIFLAEGVQEARVSVKTKAHEDQWQNFIKSHTDIPDKYPAFCGRMEIFQLYDQLVTDTTAPLINRQRRSDLQVLALAVNQADSTLGSPRLGRTRLLHEIAAQAVLDGHVPCIVDTKLMYSKDWPRDLAALLQALMRAGRVTAQRFDLKWDAKHLYSLRDLKDQLLAPNQLHPEIYKAYRIENNPDDPMAIAAALRLDLMELLTEARAVLPEAERERTKLLLLLDDLHRMDKAADDLLNQLLGMSGLRAVKNDLKVIFTYASVAAPGQEAAVKAITTWLEQTAWSERAELLKFQPPVEDRTAYEHLLLRWNENGSIPRPLAVRPEAPLEFVHSFFGTLAKKIDGFPSNLKDKFDDVIETYLDLPVQILREANDEDQLSAIQELKRGA